MCPGPRGRSRPWCRGRDLHVVAVNPSAVTANPSGTRTPAPDSSRYSSPSDAFLPPTSGTSFKLISLNDRTNDMAFGTAHLSLPVGCACATPRTAARFVRGVAARGTAFRVKFRGCRGISRSARIAVSGAREAAGGRVTARQISRTSGEAQCDCARLRWHCGAWPATFTSWMESSPRIVQSSISRQRTRRHFVVVDLSRLPHHEKIANIRALLPALNEPRERSPMSLSGHGVLHGCRSSRLFPARVTESTGSVMCQGRPRADPSSIGTHRRSSGCSRS